MSNLLDKASIILTPTAYNNGEALCVKPSDGSGDFDFSRNSAATRVNAQGLVENVQILSSNLVQNGDFSEEGAEEVSNGSFSQEGVELVTNGDFATDTDWTADYGASQSDITISNGELSFISSATYGFAKQQINVTSGKIYKITADIKSFSGSMRIAPFSVVLLKIIGTGFWRFAVNGGFYLCLFFANCLHCAFIATGSKSILATRDIKSNPFLVMVYGIRIYSYF